MQSCDENNLPTDFALQNVKICCGVKVLCYLQVLKNTKYVRIVLNHFK